MAKLEFYRQQVIPRIATPSSRGIAAAGAQATQTAEALIQAVSTVGEVAKRRSLEIEKAKEDEAAIDAASRAINIKAKWAETSAALEREAIDKDQLDGFTSRARKAYDDIVSQEVSGAKTNRSRAWLNQRASEYGINVFENSLRWEANTKVDRNVRMAGESLDKSRQIVNAKPSEYASVRDDLQLQYDPLPPEKRDQIWSDAKQRLAYDAGLGELRRNPRGLDAALKKEPGKSGIPYIDDLGADERLQLRSQTDTELRRLEADARARQAERREALKERITDQSALLNAGYAVSKPISKAEFAAAGMADQWSDYQESLRVGAVASTMVGMNPQQIQELLKKEKPTPTEANFADRAARYNALQKSAVQIVNDRNNDPIQFAETRGLMSVGQLDPANQNSFAAELKNRATIGKTMRQEYGAPVQLLKKSEAEAFSKMLGNMTPVQKSDFLKQISRSLDRDSYSAVMQQLSEGVPVTALAGRMMGSEGSILLREGGIFSSDETVSVSSVSSKILKGEELLNPSEETKKLIGKASYPMPSETLLRPAWNSVVGDAYRGDVQSELVSYEAFRAYYAAEMAERGENTGRYDAAVARRAARAVSGGVTDWNGSKIILPFGMPADKALTILRTQFNKYRGVANIPKDANLDDYELMTIGDGKYAVLQGTTPLVDNNGRFVVVQAK